MTTVGYDAANQVTSITYSDVEEILRRSNRYGWTALAGLVIGLLLLPVGIGIHVMSPADQTAEMVALLAWTVAGVSLLFRNEREVVAG